MTSPQRKMQKNINHNNHVHENSYPSSDYHLIMLMGYNETKESKLQRRQGGGDNFGGDNYCCL